jgi:hypothetical protein
MNRDRSQRAERRAGHQPEAGGPQQAQTVLKDSLSPASVRKPARIPSGDRQTYSFGEGLQ